MTRTQIIAPLVLLASACSGPTSLLLDLSLAPGFAQPDSLRITLYAHGIVGAPQQIPLASTGRSLPGRLIVRPLDPSLPDPRVQIDGLDASGKLVSQVASRMHLAAGQQTVLQLVLDQPLPDSDHDGVPDVIDDCPDVYDPDQLCSTVPPDGAAPDLTSTIDLAGADLAGVDLARLDLASVDLTSVTDGPPPDLSRGKPCPTSNLFCDDFETGDTSKWSSSSIKSPATLAVDQTQVWGGLYSLDATAPSSGGSTNAFLAKSFNNLAPVTLAARMYVRTLPSQPAFTLFLGLFVGTNGYSVGVDGSGNWVVSQNQGASPDVHSSTPVPGNQWVCLEMVLDFPAAGYPAGHVRVYTDGTKILDFIPATLSFPNELDVGLVRAPGTAASKAWVDDVALALSPIGCE